MVASETLEQSGALGDCGRRKLSPHSLTNYSPYSIYSIAFTNVSLTKEERTVELLFDYL